MLSRVPGLGVADQPLWLAIGVQPAGSTYVFLKALLAANGMSLEDIRQLTVATPYEDDLLSGKVDFAKWM